MKKEKQRKRREDWLKNNEKILEFIITNRKCNKDQINKALSTKNENHYPNAMCEKSFGDHFKYLINQKIIFCLDKDGQEVYDINYEKLDVYPELKKKLLNQIANNEDDFLNTIKKEYFCHILLKKLIEQKIEITGSINFEGSNESFEMNKRALLYASALLHDCYLTDPKNWSQIRKLKNLEIKISLTEVLEIIQLITEKIIPLALNKQKYPPDYKFKLDEFYSWNKKKDNLNNIEDLIDLHNLYSIKDDNRLKLVEKAAFGKLNRLDYSALMDEFGKDGVILIKFHSEYPSIIKIDPEIKHKLTTWAKERKKIE